MYTSEIAEQSVSRWTKTGLLDGISSDLAREKMSILLDNTRQDLVELKEKYPSDTDVEIWCQVALPIIRRVFEKYVILDTFHVTTAPASLYPFPETLESKVVICKSRRLKSRIQFTDLVNYSRIDAVAEVISQFSANLTIELDEILHNRILFYKFQLLREIPEAGMFSNVNDWYIRYAELEVL